MGDYAPFRVILIDFGVKCGVNAPIVIVYLEIWWGMLYFYTKQMEEGKDYGAKFH